ncbi:MAG: malate dehydrogenase [Kiritimatiellae bacterium]|nr:malate dehydrogenase [Kiritimatiellia bacterium]MCO6400748.1 malate dehydrogenase [Verrucomicrobiota bacterium]
MSYITNDKLVILGAAGAIGSNLAQSALTLGLTPNVCMYDPFEKGLKGAAEEMYHCAFPGANVTWTTDIAIALKGAKYLISSGGAPRKEGMTREDLLKGNCQIAEQLGKDIRANCPDLKFAAVIFNPADITGLTVLVHSGLHPSKVGTLAALDSTRLQTALAQHFNVAQDKVTGCRTYGGHGEQMAPFASTAKVDGKPLSSLIGTPALTDDQWKAIQAHVKQGGKKVIELRGRSSFQSPSHQTLLMVKAVMDGAGYPWPVGCYVNEPAAGFNQIMMAMETKLTKDGVSYAMPTGTADELAELKTSYGHLVKLRDEVIAMGVLPPLSDWKKINPNL